MKFISKKHIRFYFFIFCCIVVLYGISYMLVYKAVYIDILDKNKIKIEQTVSELDDEIGRVNSTALKLCYEPSMIAIVKNTNAQEKYMDYIMASKTLSLSNLQTNYLSNFYLYNCVDGVIFDKDRIYMSVDELVNSFETIDNYNPSDFKKYVLDADYGTSNVAVLKKKINEKNSNVLPYKFKLPSSQNLIFIGLFNMDYMGHQYNKLIQDASYFTFTLNDNVVYSNSNEPIDSDSAVEYDSSRGLMNIFNKNLKISVDSKWYNYSLSFVLSNKLFNDTMKKLFGAYLIFYVVLVVVTVGVFIYVELKFNKPYYTMSQKFLESEMNIRYYHINRILDLSTPEEDIQKAKNYLKVDDSLLSVAVILMTKESIDKSVFEEAYNTLVLSFKNLCDYVCKAKKVKTNEQLEFFLFNIKDISSIYKAFKNCSLYDENKVYICFGDESKNISDLNESSSQAKKVLKYNLYNEKEIIYFKELPCVPDIIILEPETKNKIELLITAGKADEAILQYKLFFEKNCIDMFIHDTFSTSSFVAQTVSLLIQCARTIIHDNKARNDVFFNISKLYNISNESFFIEGFAYIVRMIVDNLPQKDDVENKVVSDIVDFIDENYNDSNLSLVMISDKFNKNESYISQIVKQKMGVNFSQYLESLRMKNTEKLLKDTNFAINKIYEMVGYTNRNTFYKAFVRFFGISPKEYRENLSKEIFSK